MSEIKLQVGKTYRSREGEEVKIIGKDREGKFPYTGSNGEWYTERGKFLLYGGVSSRDLVEEVPSEPTRQRAVKHKQMKKEVNDLLLKMQTGENCIGETANKLLDLFAVSGSLTPFGESIKLLRDLADLQNGAPLEQYRKEWEETMQQVYDFLDRWEGQ